MDYIDRQGMICDLVEMAERAFDERNKRWIHKCPDAEYYAAQWFANECRAFARELEERQEQR